MTRETEAFEIMVARIHEILENEDAVIEWNDKIPDPDNPSQPRQIDVSVRKDELFNIIECRLHKSKQDVKWIEELIGRRKSLKADSIIAVSSSGFTSGAIKKARKYGVILKDLVQLGDKEILSWTKGVSINLLFFRYKNFSVKLIFDDEDIDGLHLNNLEKELFEYVGFNTIFNAHLDTLEEKVNPLAKENRNKPINFTFSFSIENFYLDNRKVQSIETKATVYLEEINLNLPEHLAYGNPYDAGISRDIYIQKYNMGETQIIHRGENISVSLDLSKMEIPPYWQFRYVEFLGGGLHNYKCLELIDPGKIIMKVNSIDLTITNNKS